MQLQQLSQNKILYEYVNVGVVNNLVAIKENSKLYFRYEVVLHTISLSG